MNRFFAIALTFFCFVATANDKPNILFISVDDLNDWIGCLGGHPQTKTPHLDRLAASGTLFTNAHCPAPACNPCRTAVFTGLPPNVSGLYENGQSMRTILPDTVLLPKYFSSHGYWSAGSGKMLHYFIDAKSWDDYFPKPETENPFPFTLYPEKRPVSLPKGGPWQYVETDWGALDATDEEFGGDWSVSKWVGEQLTKKHEKPFFLACGIYRPHEPWFVPKKYFEPFPLDEIQLPPGYREDDLDDLPPAGKRMGPNRYFAHIREHKQWRQGIQGYLASIYFADAMVGRVLDALENGPNKDTTIVVLWSDHGWHLGEKQHWQKYTAWRAVTRVPLMIRVPGVTQPNSVCDEPVNLVSLFPTLVELADIPAQEEIHAPSLVPLLENPNAEWPHDSVTFLSQPGSFGLSAKDWRYIHYANGDEELYDIANDPFEWKNLVNEKSSANKLDELRARAPREFAAKPKPPIDTLTKLKWVPAAKRKAPPSKPDGGKFEVFFINQTESVVEIFWVSQNGNPKSYGQLAPGKHKAQQTRPGAIWQIADENSEPLGFFEVGDRSAQAIIPKK